MKNSTQASQNKIFNFGAGPAMLPTEVMKEAQSQFTDYNNHGYSIMETSHRSEQFLEILANVKADMRELMQIPDDYDVLFLQGGASQQFAQLPLNLLGADETADYIDTGVWSKKAIAAAKQVGKVHVAASTKEQNYKRLPTAEEINYSNNPAYVHYTTNNTIYGTQWMAEPKTDAKLIADMSSDIMWRPMDVSKHALIYAGAQKNIGPSGLVLVIIRKDLLKNNPNSLVDILRYETHASAGSLYHTPPTFAIYMVSLVTQWLKRQGGLEAMGKINEAKAKLLYDVIDQHRSVYNGISEVDCRSRMNVTFTCANNEMESAFLGEANDVGLKALKGHRTAGGLRASIYNAMPIEGVQALAGFMQKFAKKNA